MDRTVAGDRHRPLLPLPKVVFVLGAPRSGSTLVGRVLGEVEGWFDAGEVRNLWGYPPQRACKCGVTYERCPVWGSSIRAAVRQAAHHGPGERSLHHIADWHRDLASSPRHLPRLWWRLRWATGLSTPLEAYVDTLAAVYRRLGDVTACGTIVDTSKLPSDLAALMLVPGIELFVVLLVRDPRGYVASRCRSRDRSSHWRDVVRESISWAGLNVVAETFCSLQLPQRWLSLRYEDFVTHPRYHLRRIVELVDPGARVPPVDDHRIHLSAGHALVGKGPRWAAGRVALREDRRWTHELSKGDRWAVAGLTAPVMARWRYRA